MTQESSSGQAVAERVQAADIAVGGNSSVEAMLANSLRERKPLADTGELYDSVQEAENAASAFVFVPPGTFNESVTIDTTGLTLLGSGKSTTIHGGTTGTAITVTASNVTIENLSAENTSGSSTGYDGINISADGVTVDKCYCHESDSAGISITSLDVTVKNCDFRDVNGRGIEALTGAGRATITGNIVINDNASSIRIDSGDDCVITNNICKDSGSISIFIGSGDCVVGANRVMNANLESIKIDGKADNIIFNNRLSGGTGLNDANGNSTLDGNLTG